MDNWFSEFLSRFGISEVSAVSGGVGAGVAALRAEVQHRLERVAYFLVGFAFALWVPRLLLRWLSLPTDDPAMLGAIGFVGGYFGMSLMDALSMAVKALKGVEWKKIIESWLQRGG